jgi:hypothetical protein
MEEKSRGRLKGGARSARCFVNEPPRCKARSAESPSEGFAFFGKVVLL